MTGNLNFEQEPFPEYNAREEKAKEKARLKEEARLAKEEAKRKEREEKVCQKINLNSILRLIICILIICHLPD